MSKKNTTRYTSEELKAMRDRGEGKTDWKRLSEMKDEDIDYSDIPETDDAFWANAELVMPQPKKAISLRVDEEVLAFFKKEGPGYQTRMLAVLKAYVEAKLGTKTNMNR